MKIVFTSLLLLFSVAVVLPQAKKEVKKSTAESIPSSKTPSGRVWGSTFVDYSYVAQAQDSTVVGNNGFEFRRIYLGYDQEISDHFSARVLIEAYKSEIATSGVMDFFAKHAYLEWKNLIPMANIFIGLSPTPSMSNAEKIWGYRSLEKVILDRMGLVATSDAGIGVRGKFVADGSIGYALMVANGNGGKLENDRNKKYYGTFDFEPMKGGIVELYADYEKGAKSQGKLTGKMTFGYLSNTMTFGVEGFYRNIQHGAFQLTGSGPDSNLVGASAHTSFLIVENLRAVLRGDLVDEDFLVKDAGTRDIFAVAGLDYNPVRDVHIIPNALYTHRLYKKKLSTDPSLNDDITVRLTFAYSFSVQVQ